MRLLERLLIILGFSSFCCAENYIITVEPNCVLPKKVIKSWDLVYTSIYKVELESRSEADKLEKLNCVISVEHDDELDLQFSNALDRLDYRYPRLNGNFKSKYNGAGTYIYMLDSGIVPQHEEFVDANIIIGKNTVESENYYDRSGHGTAMASLMVGKTVGVSPKATLISVKVSPITGRGTVGDLIEGLMWVKQDMKDNNRDKVVVSMSLWGRKYISLTNTIISLASTGAILVTAAGNYASDSCESFAGGKNAITVGGIYADYNQDKWYSNSGWGECVDILAPAVRVRVASTVADGYGLVDGTSPATALTAAVVSQLLQIGYPSSAVRDTLQKMAYLNPSIVLHPGKGTTKLVLQVPNSFTVSQTKNCTVYKKKASCKRNRCRWRKRKKLCINKH